MNAFLPQLQYMCETVLPGNGSGLPHPFTAKNLEVEVSTHMAKARPQVLPVCISQGKGARLCSDVIYNSSEAI
jgi:hypothetical protein